MHDFNAFLSIAAALALCGCAAGQPLESSEEAMAAKGDVSGISTSAASWPASRATLLPATLDQCLNAIDGGGHDEAALTAVGYGPYAPTLFSGSLSDPEGYETVPRVEVVGPFAVEHERFVRAFFFGTDGCEIRSMDDIALASFVEYFEDRGYRVAAERRGRLSVTKDGRALSLSATRKSVPGAGILASESTYRLRPAG